jgi:hypothetical protein
VFDVITDRHTVEDGVVYYRAHLIVYLTLASHSRPNALPDWKLLLSNPAQNCETTVDVMADLHCYLQESMFTVTG